MADEDRRSGAEPGDAKRQSDGKFGAGNNANPGGRPKGLAEFEEAAREKSVRALEKLWLIAETGRGMASVRACEIIIERAWGKAAQPITGADGGPVILRDQVNDQLEAMLRAALAAKKPAGTTE